MIDRLLTAALAFTLLAGGTTAIGSAFLDPRDLAPAPQAVASKRLPTVTVDGRHVATEDRAVPATLVQ